MEEDVTKFSFSSLRPALEKVLRHMGEVRPPLEDSDLPREVCTQLLDTGECEDSAASEPEEEGGKPSRGLQYIRGYPASPFYNRLADCLSYWSVTGNCPVFELPVMFMLSEDAMIQERKERLESVDVRVKDLHKMWKDWSDKEQFSSVLELLKLLGVVGILDLLGMRRTAGSCQLLPPPRNILLTSFNQQHHPSAKLSEGGRALAKHCHRDDSRQWWGVCTGSEAAKNAHALRVAVRILDSAHWINIHMLPHDVKVLEVRHREGYGMRWLSDGSEFRGFLEPQMKEGHAVGWRH